jgi:hypothetical protein
VSAATLGVCSAGRMSTTPPDEEPGPAFPGLKMGLGGAEHAEPMPAPRVDYPPEMEAAPPMAGLRWPRIAFWVLVLIAVAVVLAVLLI